MRVAVLFFLGLVSCTGVQQEYPQEATACEQRGYNLVHQTYGAYPAWKENYMEYISVCLEDTAMAKKLAKRDAENEEYTFIIYGFVTSVEPYQTLYEKYPIGFHCPGCESTLAGEAYNTELKKLLKQNTGLEYDTLIAEIF